MLKVGKINWQGNQANLSQKTRERRFCYEFTKLLCQCKPKCNFMGDVDLSKRHNLCLHLTNNSGQHFLSLWSLSHHHHSFRFVFLIIITHLCLCSGAASSWISHVSVCSSIVWFLITERQLRSSEIVPLCYASSHTFTLSLEFFFSFSPRDSVVMKDIIIDCLFVSSIFITHSPSHRSRSNHSVASLSS